MSVGRLNRRKFIRSVTITGGAALLELAVHNACAEPPVDTTRIRLSKIPGICIAPQYVAEPLLRSEGFTDIQYIDMAAGTDQAKALAAGKIDATINFVAPSLIPIDAGEPIVMLAGVHVGCFELFGNDRIKGIGRYPAGAD